MNDFGLYFIISKPILDYCTIAEVCVEENIQFLQFREKDLSDKEAIRTLLDLKSILKHSSTKLIVNDRPDIARIVSSDGLHLGQDDMPVEFARTIVGDKMLIGLSTHNFDQLKHALLFHPDYVGFGPVYSTTTKKNPDPVVGVQKLTEAIALSTVPVVAIGGIFPENLDSVLAAGARNICMVRYFMESKTRKELKEKIQFVKHKIKSYDSNSSC